MVRVMRFQFSLSRTGMTGENCNTVLRSPDAARIIKGEKLSTALLSLYSQCQVVKPKSPSLVVREK